MADEAKSTATENPTDTQTTEVKPNTPTVEELMAQLATEKADRAKEKQALDKALREKGELTKALRAKQTTEEQEAEAKAEAERLQNEKYEEAVKELNHIKAVNAYKSVSEKSVEKLIDAVSDADHNTIAAIIEAEKKAAVAEAQAEWMKSRPRVNAGGEYSGMTKEQMKEAFKLLKEKGAKHFGIHAFLASNTKSNDYYPILAKIIFELAVELKNELDIHIAFINLSGGVGVPYEPDEFECDIMAIGEGVRRVYEEVLTPAGMGDVAIFTEMGRFMLAPYGALIATAIHEKHTYKEYIGLDACAANLMRPAMYGSYHHITVLGKENAPCDHKYDVTGGLCENNDKFAIDRMLPKIEMGDILYIHDTGAHGHAMGYNYNGKLRSAELLLKEDGSVEMIRRAETPADYFATLDFTGLLK